MHEHIIASVKKSAFQLDQVLKNLSEEAWFHRAVPTTMSPFETVEHLAHCYSAFLSEARGIAFDWSIPFKLETTKPHEAVLDLEMIRTEVINEIENNLSEKVIQLALDFLVQHDSYHIGQLALFRISIDPNWDPYSLYQH